jgi:hypothetical protein
MTQILTEPVDCFEATADLEAALKASPLQNGRYFVLGGIVTSALQHPDTVIDHESQTIVAAPDLTYPNVRDENGTRRDIDLLIDEVLTPGTVAAIKENVNEAIGGKLILSLFGLERHEPSPGISERIVRSFMHLTTSRTIDDNGVRRFELHPLEQIVEEESYVPWNLQTPGGGIVQVLNPAGHLMAYRMCSISGLREKDRVKVDAMATNVMADPRLQEQIMDGPFRAWLDFADARAALLEGELPPDSPQLRDGTTAAELKVFEYRGKMLRTLERSDKLMTIAQSGKIKKLTDIFTGAH